MNPPPLPGPPPLPARARSTSTFVHQAARAGVIAPLLGVLVSFVAFTTLRGTLDRTATLVVAVTVLALVGIGLCCTLIGLFGMIRLGRQGLLGWSLGGLAICGVALSASLIGLNTARKSQKSQAMLKEIREAAKEFREDTQNSFDPEAGITNIDLAQYDRMQSRFDKVAADASGNDAAIAKALSAIVSRTRDAMAKYNAALQELTDAAVLNPGTLTNQSQFAARRDVVDRFLKANDELKVFTSESEKKILEDLRRLKVSPRQQEGFMRGYRSKAGEVNLLALKVRRTDTQIGSAMLAALKILEDNWGRWKYDAATDQIEFDDDPVIEAYNQVLVAMDEASTEQVALQKQIIKLQQKSD